MRWLFFLAARFVINSGPGNIMSCVPTARPSDRGLTLVTFLRIAEPDISQRRQYNSRAPKSLIMCRIPNYVFISEYSWLLRLNPGVGRGRRQRGRYLQLPPPPDPIHKLSTSLLA